ncbi:MAG: eukaryotic-like serine/threonine-protein kinase [Acidobacteriota bacterium]|jgi:serine/threonine-protein kinase|nr:eukaryotic-like serine/threonine-protein kinase [Acidobacteriota bacterium]
MEFRELTERYDLAKILHSGRSATVMRATDKRSGQAVAVKMIQASPVGFEEAAARFEAFAAALTALRHPSLPSVVDSGLTQDGGAFLVFELLEGRQLDSLAGKLPPDAGMAFLGQTLDGLEALASRGLAHGNVSPDNLFAVAGMAGAPRVTVLGLGSPIFRTGAAASAETARFLAPELAQGGTPTARSDVFSFGLTACHLLGCAVSPGDSPGVQLPFALALEVENDEALRTILERMLRRDPAERPALREVRAAFQQALGQEASVSPISPAATMPIQIPVVPEPIPEGDVLREINDEVLNALSAPPPPAPAPVEVAAAPPPPARSNRAVLFAAIAAAVVVAVLGGLWGLRKPVEQAAVPAGPPIPQPPSPQAVMAKIEEARMLLAQGEDRRAEETVRALSSVDQSTLPPEACARLAELEEMLALLAVDRFPADLARGLKEGDLGLLRAAVATGSGLGADLPSGLTADFERARKLVELHRLIEADAAEGRHPAVLKRFAELEALAPGISDPLELRAKSAQAVETEAEALASQARYDEALAKLAPLEATWSGREGLSARAAAYRKSKGDESKQQALLASIPAWERRKKPHEALDLLRGVEPTPHLRPQIEEARKRLEAQLAQLDKTPPEVVLRDGFFLEYSRGTVVELSFRVMDDYEVRGVKLMARAPGGKMREYPLEVSRTNGVYTAEFPSSFHQNGTVELYVVARDISGNEGHFGTPDKPMKMTRIGSNRL